MKNICDIEAYMNDAGCYCNNAVCCCLDPAIAQLQVYKEAEAALESAHRVLAWYGDRVENLIMFYNGPGLYHANKMSLDAHRELEEDKGKRARDELAGMSTHRGHGGQETYNPSRIEEADRLIMDAWALQYSFEGRTKEWSDWLGRVWAYARKWGSDTET
jgi:hypothetical protein